jgi:hypothetical protein
VGTLTVIPKAKMRISIVILCSLLLSCSDYSMELSGEYFLRDEGGTINDILCHCPDKREIPSNVLRYDYNEEFIIAEQKPNESDDSLYTPTTYSDGRDKIYYWIIIHSKKQVIGPMSKPEFERALIDNNIPADLKLESF